MLLAAVPIVVGAPVQAAPQSRPVDHDINNYVLFGFQSVAFKGANAAGRGVIHGGDVGSNGVSASSPTVNICANGRVTMSAGSQLVADTLRAENSSGNPCVFWDVFANRLTAGSSLGPVNSGPTPVSMPVVTAPVSPSVTCDPANPVTIRKGETAVLAPGTYGDVVFQDNTTVTLKPGGLYQLCSFHTGHDVTVRVVPGTEIRVLRNFELNQDTVFGKGAACSTRVFVQGDGVGGNDSAINFSKDTTVAGHFFTHAGKLNLGNGTNLFGTFWAGDIISDFDVNVDYCPPLGDFPITKSITGSGAGSQGEIRIDIVCIPSPPNGSIPPWIIPPGATGVVSTVVTGITLPAVCRATETDNGANTIVIVGRSGRTRTGAVPQSVGCPTLGQATGRNARLPGADIVNEYGTTTTTSATTTTSTTTTAPTTTTPTAASTTTTTSTTASTTTPPTFPPDPCELPAGSTSTTAAAATTASTSTTGPASTAAPATGALPRTGGPPGIFVGVVLATGGLALLAASHRRGERGRAER